MVLVIDIGSSSVRGMIIDHEGLILKKIQRKYAADVIGEDTVVQNPEIIMNFIMEIIKLIGEWLKDVNDRVEGISVTGQRSSVMPVTQDGKAQDTAISWQDRRSSYICNRFQGQWKEIYEITGMKLSPVFSAPKMMFIKEQAREMYDYAYKLIGFQEYVIFHLTHEFVTDTSIASRTSLFDISKIEWSDSLLELFGISKGKLCSLIPVGTVAGYTTEQVRKLLHSSDEIPVISAGGDQQCAALGLGCIKEGSMEINSGTGAYAIGISDKPVFHPCMSVNCNVSAISGKWIVEGAVLSAGKSVDWIVKEFFSGGGTEAYCGFEEACRCVPPGSNGVMISPSFAGKGTPDWNTHLRAGIFNLSFSNKKEEFARAMLEGIAAELSECVHTVEALVGERPERLRVAGGLMQNVIYCQILSDMLGQSIQKPETCEATGVGAWILAEVALGNYADFEAAYRQYSKTVKIDVWYPVPEVTKLYQNMNKLRKDYELIYKTLN